jgi:hypothetical protein
MKCFIYFFLSVPSIHENGGFRGRERQNEPAVHENGGFRGRGPGYLLYLYDVIEMMTQRIIIILIFIILFKIRFNLYD